MSVVLLSVLINTLWLSTHINSCYIIYLKKVFNENPRINLQ